MANKQLEGQLFFHDGTNYLVLDDNDWDSTTLKVKSIDARRLVCELPVAVIQEGVRKKRRQRG